MSLRSILRAILAIVLLLGGGAENWLPAAAQAHESCCCATPAGVEDACPCPRPEGNRGSQDGGSERATKTAAVLQAASRRQGPKAPRVEPSPAPQSIALLNRGSRAASAPLAPASAPIPGFGRDPDLGRQLACLSCFRI